jgi:hypothetical protein
MRIKVLAFAASLLLISNSSAGIQQSTSSTTSSSQVIVQRDAQAISVLSNSLASTGGLPSLRSIQDYSATGTITYLWAGEENTGNLTARGLGTTNYRLDANLPSGDRSWVVASGQGTVKGITGTTSTISYTDALSLSGYSFPFLGMAGLLSDSSTAVKYIGVVELNGHTAHQIQAQRTFSAQLDPDGSLGKATSQTFFIDTTTFQLIELDSFVHQEGRSTDVYTRSVQFSDYRVVNGINSPFQIAESISGQKTLSIQFSSISFNTGLTDSDFQM